MLYQVMTLNVSINSFNNTLIPLLLSNQFYEIKSSVFKKFESENLFQLACNDIVERFELSFFLAVIFARNLAELSAPLSSEFVFDRLLSQLILVLLSECFVDWLKHAFVSKFNRVPSDSYVRFYDRLCRELASTELMRSSVAQHRPMSPTPHSTAPAPRPRPWTDRAPLAARKMGFLSFGFAALAVRFLLHAFSNAQQSYVVMAAMVVLIYASLLVGKLILGYRLQKYATERCQQIELDELNERFRHKVD